MKKNFTRLERFSTEFNEEIEIVFQNCRNIKNISCWFNRLDQLTSAVEKKTGTYRQVEDHIFELKIINYLLKSFPESLITYEPKGVAQGGKNCDLEIVFKKRRYLLEVKFFRPKWKKSSIPEQYITEDNHVIMNEELYHVYQATRGHLIDVTRHTEEKLTNYNGEFISVLAVPDGFSLDIEDLRDFVFIYRNGKPRFDDPLGSMTMHNVDQPFRGNIQYFWMFPFPQESFLLEADKAPTVVAALKSRDQNVEL